MIPDIDPLYLFYGFAALAAILAVEAAYLLLHDTRAYRKGVNRRLDVADKEPDRERVLVQLRRERGLTADGGDGARFSGLRRLVVQSGVKAGIGRWAAVATVLAAGAFAGVLAWRGDPVQALVAAVAASTAGPYLFLVLRRRSRQKAFGSQFPDAIDVVVRSLRAGHPIPVAIAMVGREMPDPVGTEFGMVGDEIAYGADLENALRNMMGRVGQEDVPLFVTSVGIQTTTGGNLTQILDNLSKVIRERFKMRRKIRGLSAEARASSMILNAVPFIVFGILQLIAPEFYGEIWHLGITKAVLGACGFWMLVGNAIMRRMINFRM